MTSQSGEVVFLVQQRWKIAARPAGLRMMTICTGCNDYLVAALQHLAERVGAAPHHAEGTGEGQKTAAA